MQTIVLLMAKKIAKADADDGGWAYFPHGGILWKAAAAALLRKHKLGFIAIEF